MKSSLRSFLTLTVMVLSFASAQSQVLLNENFDDGTADLFTPLSGQWSVVDGSYLGQASGYDFYAKSLAGDDTWTDYLLEFEIRALGCLDQMVFVRADEYGNGYEINVRGKPWDDAFLCKWVDGTQHILHSTSYDNSAGEWNQVMIQAVGNELTLFFDGNLIFSYADLSNPILAGGLALAGHGGGTFPWQEVYFDNVVVTAAIVSDNGLTWGSVKALYR